MQRYVDQLLAGLRAKTEARIALLEAAEAEAQAEAAERGGPNPERNPFKEYDGDPADVPDGKTLFELDEEANDGAFEDYIADVERYLEGPREILDQNLAHHADIDLGELPPPDKLNDEQAGALYEALNGLIATFGHSVEVYPAEDCPPQPYYAYMLEVLAKPVVLSAYGHSGHGCGYWAPDCTFGQYCCCLAEMSKEDFVEQGGDPNMPEERFGSPEYLKAHHPDIYDVGSTSYQMTQRHRAQNIREQDWREANGFDRQDYSHKPPPAEIPLNRLQDAVDNWMEDVGHGYYSELTNTAILAEEVGEVARLAARLYGDQSFKRPEDEASAKTDWADELSDVLFVLTTLANQTGVDLTEAFAKGMEKRTDRDAARHAKRAGPRGQRLGRDELPF